ncbi:MAG: hypothetical protein K1X94_23030 [Sandaracinaceae bacterium]|nr:hypothetical protein [Sandaracinaceae bacterium]
MRHSISLALVGLTVVLSSCGGRTVVVENGSSGGSGYVASGGGAVGGSCRASLVVAQLDVQPGCTVDTRISGASGVLTHACGPGPAEARFGDSVFTGEVDAAGRAHLVIRTEFPFSDGCRWETKQEIEGNVQGGVWQYAYREQPLPGQSGCANACLATASIQMQ